MSIVPHLDTLDMVELDQVMSVGGVRKLAPLTTGTTLSPATTGYTVYRGQPGQHHHQLDTLDPPVLIV